MYTSLNFVDIHSDYMVHFFMFTAHLYQTHHEKFTIISMIYRLHHFTDLKFNVILMLTFCCIILFSVQYCVPGM